MLTLPFGDAGAAAAAQRADALAVFYGTPDRPLQAALQALAPAVRGRGSRVIAVLQREQAAQRDECFKAGASDLLFMPMPKEQFVARLADAVGLSYAAERGAPAAVQVGGRGNLVPLAQTTVTASGLHAGVALPFQPGETVRLSWGPFETWGLVVRASPDAQIRFAGVTPDEEARIRDWMRQAMGGAAAKPRAPLRRRPRATPGLRPGSRSDRASRTPPRCGLRRAPPAVQRRATARRPRRRGLLRPAHRRPRCRRRPRPRSRRQGRDCPISSKTAARQSPLPRRPIPPRCGRRYRPPRRVSWSASRSCAARRRRRIPRPRSPPPRRRSPAC